MSRWNMAPAIRMITVGLTDSARGSAFAAFLASADPEFGHFAFDM